MANPLHAQRHHATALGSNSRHEKKPSDATTCLICGRTAVHRKIMEVPGVDFRTVYEIAECPSCGVKRSATLPANISQLYAGQMYRTPEKSKLLRFAKGCLHRLEVRRLIKAGVSRSFCDLGCGSGDFSKFLSVSGFPAVAADANPDRPCDILDNPGIPYLQFNYETLELDEPERMKNRTVILRHVLEHIKYPVKFLEKLSEYGASHFYILVPNSSGLSKKLFGKYEGLWGLPYHRWHFDQRSLVFCCESAGLQILKTGYETIPQFLYSFHRFLIGEKAPQFLQRFFKPDSLRLLASLPLDILSINNVVFVVAKVQPKACTDLTALKVAP